MSTRFDYSYSGFVDYSCFFESKAVIWILIGSVIFFGTVISIIPQILNLARKRSNYGLNPMFVCLTNLGHFSVMTNIICMHTSDFAGIFQISIWKCLPTFLTFLNAFIMWVCYHAVIYLNIIFFDEEPRVNRGLKTLRRERKLAIGFTSALLIIFFAVTACFYLMIFLLGMNTEELMMVGHVCGVAAMCIGIAQYLPQMITTIRLRDHGSLSLVMLAIQFPGGFANALFMLFGQHEKWSSWLSTMSAAFQQMILFIICLWFKLRSRYSDYDKQSSLSTYQPMK